MASPLSSAPRPGYTLPVFACAAAVAALRRLQDPQISPPATVDLDLLNPAATASIPIDQVAPLPDGSVLAITHSDPGDNLDLTRHTPIWTVVAWGKADQQTRLVIEGGEGIGRHGSAGQAAIYRYARDLLRHHLLPRLPKDRSLQVTVILPEGRALAERTSNAAFGVVDGLSLLGTGGIAEPLSAPGQLESFRQVLREKATRHRGLVFCIGENGLDVALGLGIPADCRVKTANWLGPLLLEAALAEVAGVLLLGYHGKLIKLAGGIYHTHHHVADGRQEILTAHAAAVGVPADLLPELLASPTAEAGLQQLRGLEGDWSKRVYASLGQAIDRRAEGYVRSLVDRPLAVGCVLFDRQRRPLGVSEGGRELRQAGLIHWDDGRLAPFF